MELRDAVRDRRSIRRFLADPVPEQTINELIAASLWAPSWGNTQPLELKVVTGALLDRFKKENTEAFLSGRGPNPDIPMPDPNKWPEPLRLRYNDVGRDVFDSLAIKRNDHGARISYYAEMYSLFDAPVFLLITVRRDLPLAYCMLDVGLFLQTFCLLAWDRGLGTCILGASVRYSHIVRNVFSIPEDQAIVIGTAIGWPDPDSPVNRFERKRGGFNEFVKGRRPMI